MIATVCYDVFGCLSQVIMSIQFIKGLCNNIDSFGFDAFGHASAFKYTHNIVIFEPMFLLGLCHNILVEEDLGRDVVFLMDWLDEEVSLCGINMVNDALEGGCGDVAPAWVIMTPAWAIMGVLLFPRNKQMLPP